MGPYDYQSEWIVSRIVSMHVLQDYETMYMTIPAYNSCQICISILDRAPCFTIEPLV